jgi:hypothetical protein
MNGHLVVVDRLLRDERVDPSADDNCAIGWASSNGHIAVVERLLQDRRIDPSATDNYAVGWAASNGHLAVVERLLQDERVDPSGDDNFAVRCAAENGHLAVVDRLLQDERVDPSADDNYSSIPIRPSAGFQKVSPRRFRYRQNFAFGDRGCFAFRLPSENVNFEVSEHEFSLVVHVEVSSWCRTSAGRCDQLQTRDQAGNPVDAGVHVTFQVPSLLCVFCLPCDTTKRHCLHVLLLADLETAGAEEQRQGLLTRLQ